jgi:Cof subfamily protein (haloacid dehalogenase superfamily)
LEHSRKVIFAIKNQPNEVYLKGRGLPLAAEEKTGLQMIKSCMTVKPHIRLLAIDIDGTLLDSRHQISPVNLTALRRAKEAGMQIVLVTGRRHRFALPVAEAVSFEVGLISSNGAVSRSSRGELYHRELLPASVARAICAGMEEFRGQMVLTFDSEGPGSVVMEDEAAQAAGIRGWIEKNRDCISLVKPIEDALTSDPVQAMFCGTVTRMKEAENTLMSRDVASQLTVLRTQYEARDLCILDLLNRNCSKGHALKRWAEAQGIPREEVMAIGDNYNDVEMLEFAGLPFIMDNACDELKRNGWRRACSNDQNGVAAAIAEVLD